LLLAALMAQCFTRPILLVDYLVNIEVYKKNCINKAKPKLQCNGKCQMLKKMKKQESQSDSNGPAPKFNQSDYLLSSRSYFPSIDLKKGVNSNVFPTIEISFVSSFASSIFHPPSGKA
jgi:hypothetical protein